MALLKSLHLGYMLNGQKILFMTIIMLMLDMTALPTPEATNKLLADECRTYAEFINANTGVSKCTFVSGHGMACEEYSDKLQELFGDACSKN